MTFRQSKTGAGGGGGSYFSIYGQFGLKMEEKKVCFEEKEAFKTSKLTWHVQCINY